MHQNVVENPHAAPARPRPLKLIPPGACNARESEGDPLIAGRAFPLPQIQDVRTPELEAPIPR